MNNDQVDKLIEEAFHSSVKQMTEQELREKTDPPNMVRLEAQGMFWDIYPYKVWVKGEEKPCFQLRWGWTACFENEEDMKNLAEDVPKGYDLVIITEDQARDLLERLSNLLK